MGMINPVTAGELHTHQKSCTQTAQSPEAQVNTPLRVFRYTELSNIHLFKNNSPSKVSAGARLQENYSRFSPIWKNLNEKKLFYDNERSIYVLFNSPFGYFVSLKLYIIRDFSLLS